MNYVEDKNVVNMMARQLASYRVTVAPNAVAQAIIAGQTEYPPVEKITDEIGRLRGELSFARSAHTIASEAAEVLKEELADALATNNLLIRENDELRQDNDLLRRECEAALTLLTAERSRNAELFGKPIDIRHSHRAETQDPRSFNLSRAMKAGE